MAKSSSKSKPYYELKCQVHGTLAVGAPTGNKSKRGCPKCRKEKNENNA